MNQLTQSMLDEIYQMLVAENRQAEILAAESRAKHGYWSINLKGRFPRSKKRRIRNKWFRTGRTIVYHWIPPQAEQ